MLAKARKVDSYENMFRQKPESIFIMSSAPPPIQRPAPRSNKRMHLSASTPKNMHLIMPQDLKSIHLCLPQDLQHLHP